MHEDAARVKAVREAIGEDTVLMMDANCAYRFFEAIEFGKMVEEYHPYWFEEPVDADDYDGTAKLPRSVTFRLPEAKMKLPGLDSAIC